MKTKIAVATVSGKAYYLLINELKKRKITFTSLIPGEGISSEVKVVITTENEQHLIHHRRVLTVKEPIDPAAVVNQAIRILQGCESCRKILIGVDPGSVIGLAVLADGKVIDTDNCLDTEEAAEKLKSVIEEVDNEHQATVLVRIGDGVPECRDILLRALDNALPPKVRLETVTEAGTTSQTGDAKHRRGLRDITSAIMIAGRAGTSLARRNVNESDGQDRKHIAG